MPNHSHPCLYCADLERPRTSEHVLQNGLGGNMTLPRDVCSRCNTDIFSPLDTALVRYIRSLAYVLHPDVGPNDAFIHNPGLSFDTATGMWITVRIERETYRPITFTQVIFENDADLLANPVKLAIVLDGEERDGVQRAVQRLGEELSDPTQLKLSTSIVSKPDPKRPDVQPALIRSARNQYVIRARDRRTAEMVEGRIRRGLNLAAATFDQPQETIEKGATFHGTVKGSTVDVERALAKTALNFVCATLGPDVARGSAFDGLRRYALTGEEQEEFDYVILSPSNRPEADPVGAFVREHFGQPDRHTLFLSEAHARPVVSIILYGRPFAVVRLTAQPSPNAVPPRSSVVARFDYKNSTHEYASLDEDPERFIRDFFQREGRERACGKYQAAPEGRERR